MSIVVSVATLQLAYIIYGVIYRIFLSPLAKIPGPKLAALTSWYEFYFDVVQPGRFVWKIKDLHNQYGLALHLPLESIILHVCSQVLLCESRLGKYTSMM